MKTYVSIKAGVRTDKKRKNGLVPIYLFINRNGKTQKLSFGEFILESNWDKKSGEAKGKGYNDLNTLIAKRKIAVQDYIRKNAAMDKEVTNKEISDFWNGRNSNESDFFKFYSSFFNRHVRTLADSTQVHYVTLEKKLKYFSPTLKFKNINYSFALKFSEYLEKTGSGRFNMIKCFKCSLKHAKRLNLLIDNSALEIENKSPEGRKIYLKPNEITAIEKCDLSGYSGKIELARRIFLFSCYTSLRYSDVMNLKKINYSGGMLRFVHQKTKNYQEAPVNFKAKLEMCRYITRLKPDDFIFPRITNQTLNRNLKKIAALAGVDKDISSHVGRHTFGATLQMNDVNVFDISRLMGHKKLDQTFAYSHSMPEKLKDIIAKVKFGQSPLKNSSSDRS